MKLFVRFMVFVIGVQLLMSPSYAYISNEKTHNSDERLFQLALKRGLAVEKKDGSGNWLSMPVEGKLEVVKMIRAEFKAKGVLINNPPLYYVDQVNNVLYQSISENKLSVISDDTIRTIFQTIAVMEGDYDDGSGKSKIVQLRDFLGERALKDYKKHFPDKYQYLVDEDKKNGQTDRGTEK